MENGLGELSDRELLVRLYERINNMSEDIIELKEKPCPQAMCLEHQDALVKIDTQLRLTAAILAVSVPAIVAALLLIVDKVF